jgi:uncharacterized protein
MGVSFLTPKARAVAGGGLGHHTVAVEPIAAGETVAAFGGRCVDRHELDLLPLHQQARSIQIDDGLYMAGAPEPEPGDFVNHSCAPNCGMRGAVLVVAMRDIAVGEELSYDFAMADGDDDEFDCTCGAPSCRGRITGRDWMLPELQLAYRGYFSPYLAERISRLVNVGAERRAFAL